MLSPAVPRIVLLVVLGLVVSACSSGGDEAPASTPTTTSTSVVTVVPPEPSVTVLPPSATPQASPSADPTAATPGTTTPPPASQNEPTGFPIDPSTTLGVVLGEIGSRSIDWGGGISAEAYSRDDQPSEDADVANARGWNCRVHVEYEGVPAVDWYIPTGTPVYATMDGLASLYVISLPNAFDYYGTDREPYLGNPDRSRAPLSPFPGPGGGKGVYVEVVSSGFVTEYAHLDLVATLEAIPDDRFNPPYAPTYDFETDFGSMRAFNEETLIATWPVSAGDVIGYSGDAGYSEAPHLHYTVRHASGGLLCPTTEAGFEDSGWLLR